MKRGRSALIAVVLMLVATACAPVTPGYETEAWTFEGYQVYSHVPDDPVGIVHLFHGSNGSADFANRIETIDQLNALVERGYGWVATESTQRTGNRRWQVIDPSLVTNPDLARVERLHLRLVEDTAITASTPIFGIGMSNGARMVTLFAESFADAGYPVAAVAPFMGEVALSVELGGGLSVPAIWVVAANDFTVDNAAIRQDQLDNAATGAASVIIEKGEELLLAARFTRIPEVDSDEAEAIRVALAATGVWNSSGSRVVSIGEAVARLDSVVLPPTGAPGNEVRNQVLAILALHQFVGLHRLAVADFFDAQLP